MYRYNQHSFVGGLLDRGLMGRQDLERYFQGATKLENFLVRKQGNITKRRGTEMIADLENLFGNGDAIAYSRIIPFSQDVDEGYYILFAESYTGNKGCFIISDEGVQVVDAEGRKQFSRTINAESLTPFSIDVPYNGADFDQMGFAQSGDTLFITHRHYAPASIIRKGEDFSYTKIEFSRNAWKRPAIKSVASEKFTGTGASKTVTYVCTAVYDGIESLPSFPYSHVYKMPWPNDAVVNITCDKGDFEEEPDYYNVYKSSGSEYGLILSTNDTSYQSKGLLPSVELGVLAAYKGRPRSQSWTYPVLTIQNVNISDKCTILSSTEELGSRSHIADSLPLLFYSNNPDSTYTANGAVFGRVTFVPKGNFAIKRVQVSVDYLLKGYWRVNANTKKHNSVYYCASWSQFSCVLDVVKKDGNTQQFNIQVSYPSPHEWDNQDVRIANWTSGIYSIDSFASRGGRVVEFDFSIDLANLEEGWYVSAITIDAPKEDYSANLLINAIAVFGAVKGHANDTKISTVQDDYITPNLAFAPPERGNHFSDSGNYPSCVALYTQRLALASSVNNPFTWWMSCVGDLYNFSAHSSIRQDDAMEVTIPATEFPNINHMVLLRDLVIFCDNGEWVVRPATGNLLAFDTVECKKQSSIGCAKSIPPLQVGDELIFVDNSRRTVRSIKYQFTADGYESSDLSILSQSLFFMNPVVSMCYKQHPESTILCEMSDGTVAALVYLKEHNVIAWSHHILGGNWKCRGIASNKAHGGETTHVAMLVENPSGGTEVWRVRDDTEAPDVLSQLCIDGLRIAIKGDIAESVFSADSQQIVIDLTTGKRISSYNELADDKEYAVGYPFTSTFVSVRPEPQGADTLQWELKNAKKVQVRTLNGSNFTVKSVGLDESYSSEVEIPVDVQDGVKETNGIIDCVDVLLNGDNSQDSRIEMKHDGHFPLTIESFSIDYETQPLYGSEG
jgi:hypothetical protein